MNRRVVALAAVLGGLLATVAAASRVSAPASESAGVGLPDWVVTYAYAGLVVVALAGIPTLVGLGDWDAGSVEAAWCLPTGSPREWSRTPRRTTSS